MKALPFVRSPLWVVHTTIVALLSIGAAIMLMLIAGWLPPFWSRTVIVLLAVALLVVLLAYRWRPAKQFIAYPLIMLVTTYLWDATLPPPSMADDHIRDMLPLLLLALIGGDLLLTLRQALPFAPPRIAIYGRHVNLDEAAHFFRVPPDIMRLQLNYAGRPIVVGRSGEEYVTLEDIMATVNVIQKQGS